MISKVFKQNDEQVFYAILLGRSLILRIADRARHAAEDNYKMNNEKGLAEENV